MIESALITVALVLMVIGVILSLVPFLPGPMIVWGIAFVYTLLDGFHHVGLLGLFIMTALMIFGSTSEVWMQLLGMRMRGGSCLTTLGSVAGGLLATFVLPIPIVGTVVGMVLGAWFVEFSRHGEMNNAVQAGSNAFWVYLLGTAAETAAAILILVVFILSVYVNS